MEQHWEKAGNASTLYTLGFDEAVVPDAGVAFLSSDGSDSDRFGTLFKRVEASRYIGKRIRVLFKIKTENAHAAGVWLRIDAAKPMHEYKFTEPEMIDLVQHEEDPVTGSHDWLSRTLVVNVSSDASKISFGIGLRGNGKCWVQEPQLEVVDDSVSVSPGWSLSEIQE